MQEPFDFGRQPDGRLHGSRGGRVPRLGGEAPQGRATGQRPGLAELQRPQHPRRRRGALVLRIGVPDGRGSPRAAARVLVAARLRRLARARQPAPAQADGGGGCARGLRGRRRDHQSDPGRPARHAGTLERDLRGRRRRRHGREGRRARRNGDRAAVRRPLGPDDRHRRPAGRDVHRRASSRRRTRISAARAAAAGTGSFPSSHGRRRPLRCAHARGGERWRAR